MRPTSARDTAECGSTLPWVHTGKENGYTMDTEWILDLTSLDLVAESGLASSRRKRYAGHLIIANG